MDKLLSIIVPSYNMENYLPKCLGSLIVEDAVLLQKLDVIVVNDGSKDRTSEIAHEFERRYPGVVRVIDKPNGNYGSCINAALPIVSGRFVKILDADDTYDTSCFLKYLNTLDKLPADTDMIMNDYVSVDEKGCVFDRIEYDVSESEKFAPIDLVDRKCRMAMHAVAYRSSLLKAIQYRQTEGISYTDTEWFYLPAANCNSIRYIRLPIYQYLVGRAGQTMEKATWIKNCWMMDKLFSRMLDQYDRVDGGVSKPYLVYQLRRMLHWVLYLHMDDALRNKASQYFEELRDLAEKHSVLWQLAEERALFASYSFRFRYIEFLMKYPGLSRLVLPCVKTYCKIREGR